MASAYALPAFHFAVKIAGVDGAGDASFAEVSGLDDERPVVEIREGGENRFAHRVPERAGFGNLVLKRGVMRGGSRLGQWCKSSFENGLGEPLVVRNLDVILLDASGAAMLSWNVAGAWPVKWHVSPLADDGSEIAVETLELAYALIARS